jgi:hypothetical protein
VNETHKAQMEATRRVRRQVEALARDLRAQGAHPTSPQQQDLAEAIRLLLRVEMAG